MRLRKPKDPSPLKDPGKPSFLDRQRAARPWLDHLVRAGKRYQESNADFYAAGTTYFSILALFPLLMVGFAVVGFVLAYDHHLLTELQNKIADSAHGQMGDDIKKMVDQAIAARTTIGIIGLLGGAYAGLGWMANLRMALTSQWGDEPPKQSFLRTKLSDTVALLGLFVALAITIGLTALAGSKLTEQLVSALGLDGVWGMGLLLRIVSIALSVAASWLMFTWVIAKLPRVSLPMRNAAKAGLLTAVAFEVFKYIATFYLKAVLTGPAGATFGPIVGFMVFAYFTTRIILFATAWASTDPMNRKFEPAPVPDPVVIAPRMPAEPSPAAMLAPAGVGLLAGLGISRLLRGLRR
ncbi:inner membrane protein YhjD [Jongsikchunia kroppenstedtii]|uniref:inner membrane protein YhjD n=1 Tax=Jongsikchunia kroppenstedtii TaxID=1121721 RepID=UPI0003781A77|nr:inner membrane protein YhjD [Jongsikchunia kroppenstedtii]